MIAGVSQKLVPFATAMAAAVLAAQFPGSAAAGKKPESLVGKYVGKTEEGGTVSFQVTPSAKVVGFTLTGATLYCTRGYPEERVTYFPDYTKTVTVTHQGPIPMRGVSKKHPQGKEFSLDEPTPENQARRTGLFKGAAVSLSKPTGEGGAIVLPNKGFEGEVEYETADGPTPFPSPSNPTPEWAPEAWGSRPPPPPAEPTGGDQRSALSIAATSSPIITAVRWVLARGTVGATEASAT